MQRRDIRGRVPSVGGGCPTARRSACGGITAKPQVVRRLPTGSAAARVGTPTTMAVTATATPVTVLRLLLRSCFLRSLYIDASSVGRNDLACLTYPSRAAYLLLADGAPAAGRFIAVRPPIASIHPC